MEKQRYKEAEKYREKVTRAHDTKRYEKRLVGTSVAIFLRGFTA